MALIRLRISAGWSEPLLVAHCWKSHVVAQIIKKICSGHNFSRNEAKVQGLSELEIVIDTPQPQYVSPHQTCDTHVKLYDRFVLDRICS